MRERERDEAGERGGHVHVVPGSRVEDRGEPQRAARRLARRGWTMDGKQGGRVKYLAVNFI